MQLKWLEQEIEWMFSCINFHLLRRTQMQWMTNFFDSKSAYTVRNHIVGPLQPAHLHIQQKAQSLHVVQAILKLWQDDGVCGKERPDRAVHFRKGAVSLLLDLPDVGPVLQEGIVHLLKPVAVLHVGGRAGEDWGCVEECEGRWWV